MTITNAKDIAQLATILCIFAHPDDETVTMGGIIAAACENGQRVVCITATRGEWGVQDDLLWPQPELGEIRSRELQAALRCLGDIEHHFLNYEDGKCIEVDSDAAEAGIATFIRDIQPDSIFTFGPDGFTGHPDHQSVSRWTSGALKKSESAAQLFHAALSNDQYEGMKIADRAINIFFATDNPPIRPDEELAVRISLNDVCYEKKIAALKQMPSQYEKAFEVLTEQDMRHGYGQECFVRAPIN